MHNWVNYNQNLFDLIPDQANGNNRIQIKAMKDADVTSGECDLGNLSTRSCKINF
jgi:hypothetical protein